jgi:acetolactate synthase-1/2/3 large subunit
VQESTSFGVDLVQIFRPVTKLSVMVPSAERMQDFLQTALRVAQSGRMGPVHLSLPADILKDDVRGEPRKPSQYRATARPVDRAAIAEAAELLSKAKHPCIFAGHGIAVSGAWDELIRFAERFRIPVATTPKGKGVFPETSPLSLGVLGLGGHPRADAYLLSDYVDVLVVIGSSLGEQTTFEWHEGLKPTHAFIHVDIDPAEIGKNYAIDVGLVGDARAVLAELEQELAARVDEREPREMDPLQDLRLEMPRFVGTEYLSAPDTPLKPQRVVDIIREVLPDDAILFVDIGNVILWANHHFETRKTHTYFISLGLGSMGSAVAGAVGGKLAAPDQHVVALVGDAAFAMNGMEVHTAVDHKIPVIWVVLNNHGHGMVYHGEKMILGEHLNACKFNVPIDVAALAFALGATSFKVDTPSDFRSALERALTINGPCVIDATIDAEEVPYLLARRASTVARLFEKMPASLRVPKWPK